MLFLLSVLLIRLESYVVVFYLKVILINQRVDNLTTFLLKSVIYIKSV